MGAPKTADQMEKAIENGYSVLIENMGESIDAVLMPVVTRSTYKKGRSLYVKMGDKVGRCSLTLRNPHTGFSG
jgi:dynein heavy chain